MSDLPEWAKDVVFTETEFHFDLKDRLKILFGWTPSFCNGTATEHLPGRTENYTGRLLMLRPKWWPWKPQPMGYAESRSEPEAGI